MSLNYIEDYANAALHSLDPNVKFQAEAAFKQILQSLLIQEYPRIIEKYSQNVTFVFLLLLSKQVAKSPDIIDIFKELQDVAQKWHLPNGEFKRPTDSTYLPYHIVNTLGNTIGICMNQIYIGEKTKHQLVTFLQNQTNQLFKLFLYNHFIEAIYMINDHLDFVNYKRIVEAFQQKMIPIILQQLYPYFISVTDKMKINELSSMLPTLSQKTIKHKFDLFNPEDKVVSQLVFSLLQQIVSFKYNITSSQHDFYADSEYFLITFPESVLSVLSSKQFLEAFYFMLQKMVSMDYDGTNLETSFQCLKKILLSKFSNLSKEKKTQLIHLHYVGLFRLIRANVSSQKTLEKIMDSISKFIHNFGLVELQKNHENHIEFCSAIKQKAIIIVKGTELSSDNRLFSMTSEVICKIAKQSLDMSQQKYIQIYKNLCRDFYVQFFESYITKDFTIMGKSNVHKISGLAQILEDFFKSVNNIGSMDMGFMFRLLLSKSCNIFISQNPKKIANFFFLVTYIVEENFFDRNVIYETTPNDQLQLLGTIIRHCFQFMDFYKISPLKDKMIDVAILLFLQRIMNECLTNLGNNQEKILISSKTYEVINMSNRITMSDEEFLMFCFDELQQNLNTKDNEKVQYVLEALYIDLLKLKHTLRRESFVETMISKNILEKTIELSRNSLQDSIELLKQRRKLYKIITVLSFDDLLDSYRLSIEYVVEQLNQDFREGKYAKMIFDMSGICENIQASRIYRYFLNRINGTLGLENLIKTFYEHFGKDGNMMEEIVYLNYTFLCDKSLRMSEKQLSFFIYEIIDYSLPYVSQVLDFVRNAQWSELLNEVLKLANLIFEATYINLFLVKRKSQGKLIAFLYKLIDSILANYQWAHQYPQLAQTIHDTIHLFLTNASEPIITWVWTVQTKNQQNDFINKFVQLIQFAMDLCIHALESAANFGKKYFLSQKILETISKFYSFMRYKRNWFHRQSMIETIERIKINNQNHSAKFLQSLYKISMTNIKNITKAFNAICICIMELTYFYPKAHYNIFFSLGISAEIIQKKERIFKAVQNGKEDIMFISNLKEWLSKNEDHFDVEINDY